MIDKACDYAVQASCGDFRLRRCEDFADAKDLAGFLIAKGCNDVRILCREIGDWYELVGATE